MKSIDYFIYTGIVTLIYFLIELIEVHGDFHIIHERQSYIWYVATIINCYCAAFLTQYFLNNQKFNRNKEEGIYSVLFYCIVGMVISAVTFILIYEFIEHETIKYSYTYVFISYFGYKIFEGAFFELYRSRFTIKLNNHGQ